MRSVLGKAKTILTASGWRGRGIDFGLGAVSVLSLAPFHIWVVMILALAALCYRLQIMPVLSTCPRRTAFGRGFWFGLGYFLCGTYWIGSAFIARGPEFIPIMPPMILGLAVLLALFWGVAGYVFYHLKCRDWLVPMGFAAVFTLAELLRGHVLTGFPWNLPGYIFKAGGMVSQSASVIGIYGLTALVFLMAGFIASPYQDRRSNGMFAGIILGVMLASGYMRLAAAEVSFVEGVKLRIVKVDFDQSDQFNTAGQIDIANRYLTNSILPGAQDITHVIWPEGAVSGLAIENEPLINAMADALLSVDATPPIWLLNSARHESRPHLKNAGQVVDIYYNTSTAVEFDAQGFGAVKAYNDKSKLVPFGEFVPFSKQLAALNLGPLSTAVAGFTPARPKRLSNFPGLPKVSPQICYEIIFPGATPHPKDEPRAQWILNQSNDGWYGKSIGPHQHANQARYRAIEEGLPIIRATANGLSGAIDSYGRWVTSTPKLNDSGVIDTELPKPLNKVLNHKYSPLYLGLLCLLISLFCATVRQARVGSAE